MLADAMMRTVEQSSGGDEKMADTDTSASTVSVEHIASTVGTLAAIGKTANEASKMDVDQAAMKVSDTPAATSLVAITTIIAPSVPFLCHRPQVSLYPMATLHWHYDPSLQRWRTPRC
jgi:hypothetical protein